MSEHSDADSTELRPHRSREHHEREHSRMAQLLTLFMIFASMSLVTARLLGEHPLRSANDRSRWCTVWSLAERGTFQIDEIRQRPGWDSIDIVRHQEHFYSTKPPLLPWLVSVLYRGIRVTLGWTLDKNLEYTTRLILFLVNILPMGYALYVLTDLFRRYCRSAFGEAVLIVTACWGMLLLPFLTVFNNHTPGAIAVVLALAQAIQISIEQKTETWRFALCGFWGAFACTQELPAASLGLVLFGLLLFSSREKTFKAFVPAALVPLAAFFVTNYLATGGLTPFYMAYGTEKYRFIYEGVPSYWMDPKGIDQNLDTPMTYLFHCLLGHHGLLSLSPILGLTVASWATALGWRDERWTLWNVISLGLTGLVLAFYLTKTENYNYGGVSVALRWMLWLWPLWLLSMIPVVNFWGHSPVFRVLSVPLLAVSIFSAWYPANAPWTQPWLFQLMADWKWIDYSDPRPVLTGNRQTWIRSLPQGDRQENYWVEFRSYDDAGLPSSLKLLDEGPVTNGDRLYRAVIVRQLDFGQPPRDQKLLIDVLKHEDGQTPSQFLSWDDSTPPAAKARWAQFLAGVPGVAEYRPSRVRYQKTRVRTDAFECTVASTAVSRDIEKRSLLVIRDAWFSSEVPFGTVQWDDRVLDARSRVEYSKRSWGLWLVGETFPRPTTVSSR